MAFVIYGLWGIYKSNTQIWVFILLRLDGYFVSIQQMHPHNIKTK